MTRTTCTRAAVLMVASMLCLSCQLGSSSASSVTPTTEGPVPADIAPQGRQQGDSLGELKLRLVELRREQQSRIGAATRDAQSCEELCSLSTSICEVKEKLCDLADVHAGEDEYQGLCREAKLECYEAQKSCQACVQTHATD